MNIGFSIFLIVVGAILTFAVEVQPEGFNLNAVGIILIIGGAAWLLLSMFIWNSSPRRRRRILDEDTRIEERRIEHGHPRDLGDPPHRTS